MKLVKVQNEVKIISKLKVEDIKRLMAIGKNVQYNEKGKPIFGVDFSSTGAISTFDSITFNETTDNGYAMLTVVAPTNDNNTDTDIIKDFAEHYVCVIDKLTAFEQAAETILNELDSKINNIVDNAETIQING